MPETKSINVLNIWPIVNSSLSFDPTKPQKTWQRPLLAGENAQDPYIYSYLRQDCSLFPSVITKAEAAAVNIQPVDWSGPQAVPGIVPIPVDLTKIPVGYKLTPSIFGPTLTIVDNTQALGTASPSTSEPIDSRLDRILKGINSILQLLHQSSV